MSNNQSEGLKPCSRTLVAHSLKPTSLVLEIKGLNHVFSFKNKKRVAKNSASGKSFLMTRADVKQWMERAIRAIELQLKSACQTTGGEISMERHPQSSIASLLRLHGLDDSWQWIPELHITVEKVERGQEGAEITISEL